MNSHRRTPARQLCLCLLFAAALVSANPVIVTEDTRPVVAVLPLGTVDSLVVQKAAAGIRDFYPVRIAILPPADLPDSAYYRPNQRYRAEKILDFLDAIAEDYGNEYLKIVGITSVDISTTKGDIYDWGIFGLGYMPGRVCIISSFRLGRKNVGEKLFYERLVKVVNHELGHNFGLNHCPNQHCLMEDAKGTIKTVDGETGALCPLCHEQLKEFLNNR
jgi:archaemetzincin